MNFVRFDGYGKKAYRPRPRKMEVGQIVTRYSPRRSTIYGLRADMREAMKQGMEFSTAEEGDMYAIRRDK